MIKINLDIANLLLSLSIKKVFGGMVVSMFFVKILLLGSRQLGLPKVDMYVLLKKVYIVSIVYLTISST